MLPAGKALQLDLSAENLLVAVPIFCSVAGLLLGLCLPRPKWLSDSLRLPLSFSPPGVGLRRLALAVQGLVIAREIWHYFTSPGTFRALSRTVYDWARGRGFVLPEHILRQPSAPLPLEKRPSGVVVVETVPVVQEDIDWYVTKDDLALFQRTIEDEEHNDWEKICDKKFDNFTYVAHRRTLSSGKTEYKSTTVADDATAEEFMDFYLDDPNRQRWDTMISEADILENGDATHRCQVVRWLRTFPFSFLSKREYVIGRRLFRRSTGLYGITKAIEHPNCPVTGQVVRMDSFYSMWRSRTIVDPKGSGRPACETILLHFEDFKIPENMARFAVRHGMPGFVKKMGPNVKEFVAHRRMHCDPNAPDPQAFGVAESTSTLPAMARVASGASALSSSTSMSSFTQGSSADGSDGAQPRRRRRHRGEGSEAGRFKRLGYMLVASGVAVALSRSASTNCTGLLEEPQQAQQAKRRQRQLTRSRSEQLVSRQLDR